MTEPIKMSERQSKSELFKLAMEADWQEYYQLLTDLPIQYELSPSLQLLNVADQLMNQRNEDGNTRFLDSTVFERYLIGGIEDSQTVKNYRFSTQLLGSMHGFASFKKVLNQDPSGVDKLLRIIPANGAIDGWHFMQFVDAYHALFAENGFKQTHLFPATRLLTMKRPDYFIALNQQSSDTICELLDIKPLKKQDFQRYLDEIILPFKQTIWFKAEQPSATHLPIYRARMALFERLICEPVSEIIQIDDQPNLQPSNLTVSNSQVSSTEEITQAASVTMETNPSNQSTTRLRSRTIDDLQKTKKLVNQPKKMTIEKKKSTKGNKDAATKLMSQYYFANKGQYSKVKMAASRDEIIEKLINGESVEEAFAAVLAPE